MQWSKFSLFVLSFYTVFTYAQTETPFTAKECLEASFDSDIQAEGQLFGLIKNDLKIHKDKCLITVNYKRILETTWLVDVCREPIHMKVTEKGSLNVYKRLAKCQHANESDFCKSWDELKTLVEDKALIFAQGQKELLSTSHGQVYCSYSLLKKHLSDGILFSLYQNEEKKDEEIKEVKEEIKSEEKSLDKDEKIKTESTDEARF